MPLTTFITPIINTPDLIDAYHVIVEHNTADQLELGSFQIDDFIKLNPTKGEEGVADRAMSEGGFTNECARSEATS